GAEVHFRGVGIRQGVRVEAGLFHALGQVVAMHAGEQVGVEDVGGAAVDDHLLVFRLGVGFVGGDKGRADVGQVGPGRLCREDGGTVGYRVGLQQRAVYHRADRVDRRDGRQGAGVAARGGGHGDEGSGGLLDGLAGEGVVGDVVQDDAAPAVDLGVDV